MKPPTIESCAAGARTEGHFVAPVLNGRVEELRKVKTLTALTSVETDNLCSDCRWSEVCKGDVVCWHYEREVTAEVVRYRRREARGQLTGTVADVGPVSQLARVHGELDAVARLVDDAEQPVEIVVPAPLPAANQRLMDVLGVTVTVRDTPVDASVSASSDEGEKPEVVLVEGEGAAAASSPSTSPPFGLKRKGRGYDWTREAMVLSFQAFHARHGSRPGWYDLQSKQDGDLPLPGQRNLEKDGLKLSDLIALAGLTTAPTRSKKDSSGLAAASTASQTVGDAAAPDDQGPDGGAAPVPAPPNDSSDEAVSRPSAVVQPGVSDDQEPGPVAGVPAPPAGEAHVEQRPVPAAEGAGAIPVPRHPLPEPPPQVRAALIGVLDSLRVLVDVVLPEGAE